MHTMRYNFIKPRAHIVFFIYLFILIYSDLKMLEYSMSSPDKISTVSLFITGEHNDTYQYFMEVNKE